MINERRYDLEERTFKFSRQALSFCAKIPKSSINNPIVSQLVRAATSIGANYAEANVAPTKKDFLNKMSTAGKEINETKYWLKLVAEIIAEDKKEPLRNLYKEVRELHLIFSAIIRKGKLNPLNIRH